MTKSAYEILGIPRNASQQDIETAWRKAAQTLHPDRNPGDAHAHERFIQAQEAYNQLRGRTTAPSSSAFDELAQLYYEAATLYVDYYDKKDALKQLFRDAVRDFRQTHSLPQHLTTRWIPLCQRYKAAANLLSLRNRAVLLQDIQTGSYLAHIGPMIDILKNKSETIRDRVTSNDTKLLNIHIKRLRQQTEAIDNALAVLAGREPAVKFSL